MKCSAAASGVYRCIWGSAGCTGVHRVASAERARLRPGELKKRTTLMLVALQAHSRSVDFLPTPR